MPRLQAKVEGKGNGVKTVIANMVEVAKSLGRPPTYTTKYFGCELGAQTQFDFKNERYIVNGAHDAAKLQDMLDGFIKKFVLCEKCDNPETVLKVYVKKGIITASCKACGHSFTLDMRHKLTTYILRNPPEQSLAAQGTSLTEKRDKRSVRREQNKDDKKEENGDDWNDDDNDDKEWITDVSEEAVKQRMMELTSGVKGLAMDADTEKTEGERINIFHSFLKQKQVAKGDSVFSDNEGKEIHQEAERLEIVNKATIVLCEVLLGGDVVPQVKKNKRLFLRFTNENQKAQKYLIGGIEKTIEANPSLLEGKKVVAIFKAFYDLDILDEEIIIEWGKKVSKKYVSKDLAEQIHKKAEPFVTWLKEAEEESDDEEDGVQLEFDEKAHISSIKEEKVKESTSVVAANGRNGNKEDEDEEEEVADGDDLDIDNI